MVLTDDQRTLQDGARRFARERLLPDYQKREKADVLDRRFIKELAASASSAWTCRKRWAAWAPMP